MVVCALSFHYLGGDGSCNVWKGRSRRNQHVGIHHVNQCRGHIHFIHVRDLGPDIFQENVGQKAKGWLVPFFGGFSNEDIMDKMVSKDDINLLFHSPEKGLVFLVQRNVACPYMYGNSIPSFVKSNDGGQVGGAVAQKGTLHDVTKPLKMGILQTITIPSAYLKGRRKPCERRIERVPRM